MANVSNISIICNSITYTIGGSIVSPVSIVLSAAGTRAFVTNVFSDTVSRCEVDASGNFSACANTGGTTFDGPAGIALN